MTSRFPGGDAVTTPEISRKFTLLDAMILVAAFAAGFVLTRGLWMERSQQVMLNGVLTGSFARPGTVLVTPSWLISTRLAWRWLEFALPVVAWLTVAFFLLRLRCPRPSLFETTRQPGLTATGAASASLLVGALSYFFQYLLHLVGQSVITDPAYFAGISNASRQIIMPEPIGHAVLGSWAVLALGKRWRREPGWIDGAGAGLGVVWIAILACYWIGRRLM